jgi:hypothetical protein
MAEKHLRVVVSATHFETSDCDTDQAMGARILTEYVIEEGSRSAYAQVTVTREQIMRVWLGIYNRIYKMWNNGERKF